MMAFFEKSFLINIKSTVLFTIYSNTVISMSYHQIFSHIILVNLTKDLHFPKNIGLDKAEYSLRKR